MHVLYLSNEDLLFDIQCVWLFCLRFYVAYNRSATAQTCITMSCRQTIWHNDSSARSKTLAIWHLSSLRNQIKSVKARKCMVCSICRCTRKWVWQIKILIFISSSCIKLMLYYWSSLFWLGATCIHKLWPSNMHNVLVRVSHFVYILSTFQELWPPKVYHLHRLQQVNFLFLIQLLMDNIRNDVTRQIWRP